MLKIEVNSHIKGLLRRYKDVLNFLQLKLSNAEQRIKFLEQNIAILECENASLKSFKKKVMMAECYEDLQYEHITMCYRISKVAVKTARFPEHLFELGWKEMVHQISKCRHEN